MTTFTHYLTAKSLGPAAVALMLTLGAPSQALARDRGGHQGHAHGHYSGHQQHRGHKNKRHHHRHYDHRYRYGRPHRHYRKRHHYEHAYGAFGLGVLTGYLLNHQY